MMRRARGRFTLGLDLAQAAEYTGIALLERVFAPDGPNPPGGIYHCRHLERIRHTAFPAVAERVKSILAEPQLRGQTTLVVDATGVGAAVLGLLKLEQPVVVTLAGEASAGVGLRLRKQDLVGVVQVLLQTERLRISTSLPLAETLTAELTTFRMKVDPLAAQDIGSWREGDHDDLVLALAVAAWHAELPDHRRPRYLSTASVAL